MRLTHALTLGGLTLALAVAAPPWSGSAPAQALPESDALQALVEDYYEKFLVLHPVLATFNGDHRYDDRFTINIGPKHMRQTLALEERYLAKIEAMDPEQLDGQDRLTWEIFRRARQDEIEGFEYPDHLLPVNQLDSVPSFIAMMGSGSSVQPFNTAQDYENWLKRVAAWPAWVDRAIVNMREGVEKRIVQPRALMVKVLPQLKAHMVGDVEESIFFTPARQMPRQISQADRERLTGDYRDMIMQQIIPAYKRLHDYIRDEYMPHTRGTSGLFALPNGRMWYAYLTRRHTTTDLSPDQIHEIGLREVERLRAEMDRVREQLAYEGDLDELLDSLWNVAELHFTSEEDVLETYRRMKPTVRERAKKLFAVFPKADFEIRKVEEFRQASAAGASYMAASPDGLRPGIFYVNTRYWERRTKQDAESLFLHEAVPGHHFQTSIQRELEELPRFRRFGGYTAYLEGWALYAETLGKEMGMYADPYQYLGALRSELFRAQRLVVDTGLHARGWTREQAIEYMQGNVSEVERYMAIPGQALAYKMGQLKISELRERASAKLGDHFDVREFHSEVLRDGALPLDVLETKIDRWINTQMKNVSSR